jgi:AmmeMemoRadiSam system protein B
MRLATAFDGSFYPAERDALEEVVDLFLARAPAPPEAGRLIGALVPHAGYVYSGRTAGMAFGALRAQRPDAVVLLAPSHRVAVHGCRVFELEGFETPLGPVPSSPELAASLVGQLGAQARGAAFCEHAIEVQLPFLQRALPGVPVVAVVFGAAELTTSQRVAQALADEARRAELVVVASSDLSHYYPRNIAQRLDGRFRSLLVDADVGSLARSIERGEAEACGAGAVLTLVALTQEAKGRFTIVDQTDSSEASGDESGVVGYLSALAHAGGSA